MKQVILFYAHPNNFDDSDKFKIARIINEHWDWGVVCEGCFKNVDSIARGFYGRFLCPECEKKEGDEKPKHYEGDGEINGPRDIEYIASLNDPKAFEGVNLGIIKRNRKNQK